MTRYWAVYDGNYDYIQRVETDEEYDQNYGRIHADYRPRCRGFDTREEAEKFMMEQNNRAREKYSR